MKIYSIVIQNASPIKFIDFTFYSVVKFLPLFARSCQRAQPKPAAMQALFCCRQMDTAEDQHPNLPHHARKQQRKPIFQLPLWQLTPQKEGFSPLNNFSLTPTHYLWCWQRGWGTCSVGLKGWWSPLVCCQRKARADCSSAADSSSFQTEIGLLEGKASLGITVCKMDCSGHLVKLPPAPLLSSEPVGVQHYSSLSRDICKVSRTLPLQVHLVELLSNTRCLLVTGPELGLLRPSLFEHCLTLHWNCESIKSKRKVRWKNRLIKRKLR